MLRVWEKCLGMKELQPNGKWKKIPLGIQKQKFVKDFCRYCGTHCRLTADHVIPKSRGGAKDVTNLQPLCYFCNSSKGDYTEEEIQSVFDDVNKRGVWYKWEYPFSQWLIWLQIKTKERRFDSKLKLWKK